MSILDSFKKLGYTDPSEEIAKKADAARLKVERHTKQVRNSISDIIQTWESEGGWVESLISEKYQHGNPYSYSGFLIFTNEDLKKRNLSYRIEVAFGFADGHETTFAPPTRNQIMHKIK